MANQGFLKPVIVILVGLLGCACATVEPWERGRLARAEMQWDPDPLIAAHRNHAYFSNEGTNGEIGAAGGGCGCN